uniref:Calmodulin n=1 Tax=Compsopogon caeruleus TaxID=31354 RepID=A0A7S1TCK7_9RHOD
MSKLVRQARSCKIVEDFEVGRVLGRGSFGTVTRVVERATGREFACKSLSKARLVTDNDRATAQREVDILQVMAGNPNVVHIEAVYEDADHVHFIMELCRGGELFDRIVAKGHYSESDAAMILRKILSVLKSCHENNIAHRDIKPENFLFVEPDEDSELKAIDFGLSCFLQADEVAHDVVGTPIYIAPEVLRRSYTTKADIWSAGVVLYILLSGKLPFYGTNEKEELRSTLRGHYNLIKEPWPSISEPAKDVVRKMLTMDYNARPDAETLLSDPWVREGGIASTQPLVDAVVAGIGEFLAMNRLKKRALQVIALNCRKSDMKNIKNLFENIDEDGSGTITLKELQLALATSKLNLPELDAQELLNAYDVDGDGVINYSEFLTATSNLRLLTTAENIRDCFRRFDIDEDGSISVDEVREILRDCDLSDDAIMDIVDSTDHNKDGRIDYDEFYEMMKKRSDGLRDAPSRLNRLAADADSLREYHPTSDQQNSNGS